MRPSDDFAAHVMLAACNWEDYGLPRINPRHASRAHLEFDDRRLSHTVAGQIVWACTLAGACAQSFKVKYGRMFGFSQGQKTADRVQELGLSIVYANIVDPHEIRAELRRHNIPAAAIDEFIGVVVRAKKHVLASERELEEFHEIAVELPLEVFRARQAYFAEHADAFAELDRLAESLDKPETLAAIEALRSKHMNACGEEGVGGVGIVGLRGADYSEIDLSPEAEARAQAAFQAYPARTDVSEPRLVLVASFST